jgi:hypothetical protein
VRDWLVNNGYDYMEGDKFDEGMEYLSTYFSNRRQTILKAKGKTQVGWDEFADHKPEVASAVIQNWLTPRVEKVTEHLKAGYPVIISDYTNMYLDCGFGHWIVGAKDEGGGKSWCDPFKTWEAIYNDEPTFGLPSDLDLDGLILGGEVAMWSETADESNIEYKIFPRSSAAGERYWSKKQNMVEVSDGWARVEQEEMFFAYRRILIHRSRLADRGLAPTRLQPEWCKASPKGFCWYPCTCDVENNDWYSGPNDKYNMQTCPWCKDGEKVVSKVEEICPVGSFCVAGVKTECPPGSYTSVPGSSACLKCASDISPDSGMTFCGPAGSHLEGDGEGDNKKMVPLGALVGVAVVAALALAAVAALVVAKRRQDTAASYTSDGFGPGKVNGGAEQTIEMPEMGAGDAASRPTSSSTLSTRDSTSSDV